MTIPINALIKFVTISFTITILTACGALPPHTLEQAEAQIPTASEIPTNAATFTPNPAITLSPIENPVQKVKGLSEKCQAAYDPNLRRPSPDGNWNIYDCPETFELFIINHDGSKVWHLEHSQLSNPDTIYVSHWSSDNQYVYFIPGYVDIRVSSIDPLINQLWQFNVKTGEYFNVFLNIASYDSDDYPSTSAISFSPTDKFLLIIPQRRVIPPIVYIYDLEKNKVIHSFTLAGSTNSIVAGNVVWSPDEQRFAMISASGGDFEYYQEGEKFKGWQFSVIIVDVKNLSQKVIISEAKRDIYLHRITGENILIFESSDPMAMNQSETRTDEQYDLSTNRFLSTPTPSP
jgi:hypothetical protein